jgi:ubiquinone/menaquinone biosynthesis C-methylase UbiE
MHHRLRRWLFERLYDRLAPAYDTISWLAFAGEWARWQALADRFIDRLPVVELGCGTGQVVARLRRGGRPIVGLDTSAPMLRQARRRAAGRLVRADARALPLRTASVGTLLAIFPTAYILAPATGDEVARVLQPGGRLVVIDHAWLAADGLWRQVPRAIHAVVYAGGQAPPAPLPGMPLPALSLVERSAHGFASVTVAAKAL